MASNVPVFESPYMADKQIQAVMKSLEANLSWLDAAYGRAQKIERVIGEKSYYLPAAYLGKDTTKFKNEYIELAPDSRIGNFSFFWMLEPQIVKVEPFSQAMMTVPFALIFWFDLRKIFANNNVRDTEQLKHDILKCLMRQTVLPNNGYITIGKIYETAQAIYREFSINEIDNQFLMHPYGGFRFEGQFKFLEEC